MQDGLFGDMGSLVNLGSLAGRARDMTGGWRSVLVRQGEQVWWNVIVGESLCWAGHPLSHLFLVVQGLESIDHARNIVCRTE